MTAASELREHLTREAYYVPERHVWLALSGGLDSLTLGLALQESGHIITATSFMMDGHVSRDFRTAQENARRLGWRFIETFLPTDPERLWRDVNWLIKRVGCRKKTSVECVWPFMHVFSRMHDHSPELGASHTLVTGAAADGHYALSKKAMIHYRYPRETFDEFRRDYFANPDRAQTQTVQRLGAKRGYETYAPWRAQPIVDFMLRFGWNELNKPHQKQILRDAYAEELAGLLYYPHTNLQLGDSGIATSFEVLLSRPEARRYRTVTGLYNAIARGDVG